MTDDSDIGVNRRDLIQGALALSALSVLPIPGFDADNAVMQAVLAQVPRLHDQTVKALQAWIALPSIAAENRIIRKARNTWRS